MKKFTSFLTLLLLLTQSAGAALSPGDRSFIPAYNLLSNPGWEYGKTGWTASGGTYATSLSSPLEGGASAAWTPTAQNQTLSSAAIAVPAGLQGRNGVLSCLFQTLATDVKMQVTDGSGNILAGGQEAFTTASWSNSATSITVTSATGIVIGQLISTAGSGIPSGTTVTGISGTTISISSTTTASQGSVANTAFYDASGLVVSASGVPNRVSLNFIGPTSGSVIARFISNSSTSQVKIDSCQFGAADTFNLAQLSQAQVIGTISVTCSAPWNVTNNLPVASVTPTSGCVYTATGSASAPTTNIPAIVLHNVPAGELLILADGTFEAPSALNMYTVFSDGTNNVREVSSPGASSSGLTFNAVSQSIAYTTPQPNLTLNLLAATTGGTSAIDATASHPLVIKVYSFPSQQQTAYRPDATPASWSGFIGGASPSVTVSSGVWTDFGAQALTVTQFTNRNFGTVSQAAGSLSGIQFTPPRAGIYEVCAVGQMSSSTAGGTWNVRLVDGSNNPIGYGPSFSPSNSNWAPWSVCGQYLAGSNFAPVNVKIQIQDNNPFTMALGSLSSSNVTAQFTVKELDAPLGAPYIFNQITSGSSGQERFERASMGSTICSSGTCALSSSTSGISSITFVSTGKYLVNFAAGTFSAMPTCIPASNTFGNGASWCSNDGAATSTTQPVRCLDAPPNSLVNESINIVCMGPH